MIRRKNSFGYIDFIRGKYIQNNVEHLKIIFEEMSIDEREANKNTTFYDIMEKYVEYTRHQLFVFFL